MSDSDDAFGTEVGDVEEALNRLNLSIQSYNTSRQEGGNLHSSLPDSAAFHSEASQTICDKYAQSVRWLTGPPLFGRHVEAERHNHYPSITNTELRERLTTLQELRGYLAEHPYSVDLYSRIATAYAAVGYPDLAVGAAYKALLLVDQLDDEDEEYYGPTFLSVAESISKETLPRRCRILRSDVDLQRSLFDPRQGQRDDDGRAIFPVLAEEVHIWAKKEYSQKV